MALIIIGEEYPTRWRSFGIALLGGIGALGTIIAFLTARLVLTQYDWRTMYLLGLIPVALVFFFRLGMRETRRFEALRESGGTHTSLREQLAALRVPFQRRYRKRSLLVTLIWNCNHLVTSPAVTFWTIHAARDLGYGPQQYTVVVAAGYLVGFLVGAPLAGFCMNRFGRRLTCALYYLGAAVSIFTLFQVDSGDLLLQTALMSVTIVCFPRRQRRDQHVCDRAVPHRDPRHRLQLDDEPLRPLHRDPHAVRHRLGSPTASASPGRSASWRSVR